MTLASTRLDKFVATQLKISRRDVRILVAQKRITVDDKIALSIDLMINRFSQVVVNNQQLPFDSAVYLMLHKPVGVVSATKDDKHKTVLDLINEDFKSELHIVGRLDLNTSGLVLLTNDSRWSEALTSPEYKVKKHYQVALANKLNEDYIQAFEKGMYFDYEDITTQPAKLNIIDEHHADVWLTEGKYHQVKRMFGRFNNPVTALHRVSIGAITLDPALNEGEYRLLDENEIASVVLKTR